MQPSLVDQPAKLQTLKTAILADPTLAALFSQGADGYFQIAFLMNLAASPNYFVWAMGIQTEELIRNDGFDWTRIDNLTVGKARIWDFMTRAGGLNFNRQSVRNGILACFATAGDTATRLAIFQEAQRLSTRAEKLYATGAGTTTNDQGVGPATVTEFGILTTEEIQAAHDLP